MNLELVDPFELHSELPEVIEAKLDDGDVAVCAFNRRGNLLAGGCTDGKVLIWDFDTHGVSRTFEGHAKSVTAIAWTRSSRRLFSASADGTLLVWEVLTGNRLAQVDLGVPVHLAVLHPRNRDLCLACVQAQGAPGAIFLQHLRKPEQRTSLLPAEAADDAASSASAKRGAAVACFDQQGERVLMATARGAVHVASVPGGELLATLQVSLHPSPSPSLSRSPSPSPSPSPHHSPHHSYSPPSPAPPPYPSPHPSPRPSPHPSPHPSAGAGWRGRQVHQPGAQRPHLCRTVDRPHGEAVHA